MIDLSHIHPMLVHFPLALLPIAVLIQWWVVARGGSQFDRSCQAKGIMGLLALAAIGALIAAAFGDMALDIAVEHGIPDANLEEHEDLGFASAWLLLGLAVLQTWLFATDNRVRLFNVGMTLASTAVLGILLATAYHGGELVYGLGVNVG